MDDELRRLEKNALSGDHDAIGRLESYKRRMGNHPPLPVLTNLRYRMPSKNTREAMGWRPNRNQQRLQRHKDGICNLKCRFCRKYGAHTKGKIQPCISCADSHDEDCAHKCDAWKRFTEET